MTTTNKPVAHPTPETQDYWNGCQMEQLLLQHCSQCSNIQFPPRRYCCTCLSDKLDWKKASGRGHVISFTIVRHPVSEVFAADVPYIVALVILDEGPTMMSGIRGCEIEDVSIGMSVEVEFESRSEEINIPYFHPASSH